MRMLWVLQSVGSLGEYRDSEGSIETEGEYDK